MAYGNGMGDYPKARHHGQADQRDAARDMPGVQPDAEEQNRPMPERVVPAGRGGGIMPSLWLQDERAVR